MLVAWIILLVLGLVLAVGLTTGHLAVALVAVVVATVTGLAARRVRSALRDQAGSWVDRREPLTPLVLLPVATAVGTQSRPVSLGLLILIAAWMYLDRSRAGGSVFNPMRALPATLLVVLFVLVWGRNPGASGVTIGASVSLVVCSTMLALRKLSSRTVLLQLTEGVGIYLILSVVLYLLGLRSPSEGLRIGGLENSNGIFGQRALFPLSSSYVTAPALAAGFIAALPGLSLAAGERGRLFRWTAAAAAAGVLLAANYRGPLVFGLVIAFASLVRPSALARVAPWLAVAILAAPFWYSTAAPPVTASIGWTQQALPGLDRGPEASALSGREEIWRRSVQTFYEESTAHQLVGFGAGGHVTSGASTAYAPVVRGLLVGPAAQQVSPHNSVLQVLFDAGIVGAIAIELALFLILRRLASASRRGSVEALGALGALTTYAIIGATEIILAPAAVIQEPCFYLLMYGLVVCYERRPSNRVTASGSVTVFESANRWPWASPLAQRYGGIDGSRSTRP